MLEKQKATRKCNLYTAPQREAYFYTPIAYTTSLQNSNEKEGNRFLLILIWLLQVNKADF